MIYELQILSPNEEYTITAKLGQQVSKADVQTKRDKLYFSEELGLIIGQCSQGINRITLFRDNQGFQLPMGEYDILPNMKVW